MVINTKIRISVIKRIIRRLEEYQREASPYGYEDFMKIYWEIDYWYEKLEEFNNKK